MTGVSGSGKSTLVTEVLYRALARELNGSREPVGAHDALEGAEHDRQDHRDRPEPDRADAALQPGDLRRACSRRSASCSPASRSRALRGYTPGRFSFNVKGGRCENCKGDGILKIEMQFLPDVYVPCEVCKGKRYNREALEIHYKGKSIADVLEMTIAEALEFFSRRARTSGPSSRRSTTSGLGYVHLGQPATTLSGGEAQRVKLSTELSRRATGRTLYVLDEPTTGLHFADVEKLLEVLHRLVDGGNTVLVIEHNLDVIKTADWIVDLGPGGRRPRRPDHRRGHAGDGRAAPRGRRPAEYLARVLRGEPLVPLSDVTFAEEAGRAAAARTGNGHEPAGRSGSTPSRKRAAAAAGRAERVRRARTIRACPTSTSPSSPTPPRPIPGQKFHVLGGGVARIGGRRFPLRHPHLALVIGLQVTAPETDREHEIRFVLLDPDGGEVAGATGSLVARSQRDGRDAVADVLDRPVEPDLPGARRLLVPDPRQRLGAQAAAAPAARAAGPGGRRGTTWPRGPPGG